MQQTQKVTGEIVMYQPDETIRLEVRIEDETVWLNRQQMAVLFARDVKTIGKHINNALREELKDELVGAKFATTATDGKTYQVEYYSLDMILSVGYRVKSSRGVEFRKWSNKVLKQYLIQGYVVNQRITTLEHQVADIQSKVDFFVRTSLPPVEGIFYDGQIFDAYTHIVSLIKQAKKSVVLVDNYIDENTLTMLSRRNAGVAATIYTRPLTSHQQLDVKRHNQQYPPVTVNICQRNYDRFLIIDDDVYLFGASLKDAGKKTLCLHPYAGSLCSRFIKWNKVVFTLGIHIPTDHDSVADRMTFSYRLNDAFGIDIHY